MQSGMARIEAPDLETRCWWINEICQVLAQVSYLGF